MDILPYFLAAGGLVAVGALSWRSRRLLAVRYLIATFLLCAVWAFSEAFSILSTDVPTKLLGLKVTHTVMSLAPVTWLGGVVFLTGQLRKLMRRYSAVLFFIPTITILILWTGQIGAPGLHGELMITNVHLVHIAGGLLGLWTQAPLAPTAAASPLKLVLAYNPGTWFYVQLGYSIILMLVTDFLLARALLKNLRSIRRKRRLSAEAAEPVESDMTTDLTVGDLRTVALLIASGIPPVFTILMEMLFQLNLSYRVALLAGNSVDLMGITWYSRSAAPAALVFSVLLIAWMLVNNQTLQVEKPHIIPVARSALVDSMRDGVLVLDRQNRILDFNPAAQHLVSTPLARGQAKRAVDVLRRGLDVHIALADFPDLLAALGKGDVGVETLPDGAMIMANIFDTDNPFGNTVRLTRQTRLPSSGKTPQRFVDLRVSAIFEKSGQVSGRVVVLRDITERKRSEDEVRRLKDFNEAIVQSIAEGIAVEDADGIFTFINPAGAAMLGYAPDELIGVNANDLVAPENLHVVDLANQRRRQGQSDRYELDVLRKDDSTITVLLTGTPLFNSETNQFSGTVDVFIDITERKLAEMALSASEKRHRRLVEQLAMLSRIGLAVFAPGETGPGASSPRDMNSVIHVLYQQCLQIGEMDCFYVALYNENTQMLRFPVFYNRDEHGVMQVTSYSESHLDDYTGLTGYVVRAYQTLYIADLLDSSQLPELNGKRIEPMLTAVKPERSFLAVPLILGVQPSMLKELAPYNRRAEFSWQPVDDSVSPLASAAVSLPAGASRPSVVGVISMQSYQPNMYTEEQIKLLETVAVQAAIALENSRLYERLQHELEQRCQAEDALRLANEYLQEHVDEIESLQANLQASLKQMAEQAIRDPLTNLFNRRYLHETLERELVRAARQGLPVSLVMADIDYFKPLNDTFLHDAGDRVLQVLSDLLRTQSRQDDIACRYGGEEFVVVMPGAPLDVAYQRAERWRQAFSELEFQASDVIDGEASAKVLRGKTPGTFRVTISLGIAVYPNHGMSGDMLLRAADRALYAAKEGGRNQTRVYS